MPSIRASSIDRECPWRDHQQATGRWERASTAPMLRGTAVHAARAFAVAAFKETGEVPGLDDLQETARAAVEERASDENGMEVVPAAEATAALDEAMPLVEADAALLLPGVVRMAEAAEEPLEADLGDGWSLTGTLDVRGTEPTTKTGIVVDLKTGKKAPAPTVAALSSQLTAYSLLHEVHYGHLPLLSLHHVWVGPKGPTKRTIERDGLLVADLPGCGQVGAARIVSTRRTRWDADGLKLRLRARIDAEEAGWFPPAPSGFMSPCARCPHWAHPDPQQRCEFATEQRPATTAGEEDES